MLKKSKLLLVFMSCIFLFLGCNIRFPKASRLSGKYEILAYGDYAKYLTDRAKVFCLNNPRVKIDVKEIKKSDYFKYVKDNIKNDKQKFDGVLLSSSQINEVEEEQKDYLYNVTKLVNDEGSNIFEWRKNECKVKDEYYGYPLDTTPIIMYYNKDIFNKYGINDESIVTWHDFINIGKRIKQESKEKDYIINTGEWNKEQLISILANEIRLNLENEDSKKIKLDKVKNLFLTLKNEKLYTDSYGNIKNSALILGSSKFYINIKKEFNKINWGYIPLPAFEQGGNRFVTLQGMNLSIINNDKNKYTLEQFIKFVTNDKIALLDSMFKYGIFPANTQCYKHAMIDSREENVGYRQLWQSFANIVSNTKQDENYNQIIKDNKNEFKELLN